MNIHKISRRSLLALAVAVVCVALAPGVQAQNLGDLLNQVIKGAPQQQAAPQPPTSGQLPSGLQPSAAPPEAVESVLWANKAEFLAVTRNGDLIAIDRAAYFGSKELTPIAISIASILHADYGVALPFSLSDFREKNPNKNKNYYCIQSFEIGDVVGMLSPVTEMHAKTLSQEPPDFYKAPSDDSIRHVETAVRNIKQDNSCDQQILGARKPHPYKAALLKLMDEYGQATKDYVEAERGRRKTAYAEEQAQKQAQQKARDDVQAKQDADARAAKQQRIDEERARIQHEQKRREEQNKNRVGG